MSSRLTYKQILINRGRRKARENQASLLGYSSEGVPLVAASPTATGRQLTFACPFCGQQHSHGVGAGHRVPHCYPGELAPERGYILVEVQQ